MEHSGIHEKTRAVYHEQHKRVLGDERAMQRFLNMVQEEYFGLEPGYFNGKRLIDVGCGNTAKLLIRFHDFGCTDLTGLELGEEFKMDATTSLINHKIPKEHFTLRSGSALKLPFDDESFDFVCCHGVLLHLADFNEVEQAFKELARICKTGGRLYVVTGVYGGLVEFVLPSIRKYYRENKEFHEMIDSLTPETFRTTFTFITEKILEHEGAKVNLEPILPLLDTDLCVTIQNLLQAPVRLPISEEMLRDHFKENGFSDVQRLKRYVKRENIRRYLAPLHYYSEQPVARLLYGQGNLEFIGRKS